MFTLLLGGWAAWMTGRATAITWRPYGMLIPYLLILAAAVAEAGVDSASPFAPSRPKPARVGGDDAIKTVKREEPKVGRNDPCPCGSGKKYKKCHGANQ